MRVLIKISTNFTLAYIDILMLTKTSDCQRDESDAMLIILAGDGSYLRPFYIDTNDALLRAIPSRLEILRDQVWLDFIASMNLQLRLVPDFHLCNDPDKLKLIGQSLLRIVQFVERFNNQHHLEEFEVHFYK